VKLDLVGCHGQTLYHQGVRRKFSAKVAVTWQTGEGAVIAARLGAVVSDFRSGICGAVMCSPGSLSDYFLYRTACGTHRAETWRIANLRRFRGASLRQVVAFTPAPATW